MIKRDKKGISPVVATVILVSIVIVIGIIIFMWALGIFGEQAQKFGSPIEESCNNIQLSVSYDSSTGTLDIVNNDPQIPLFQLILNVESDGGLNPSVIDLDGGIGPGGSSSIDVGGDVGSGTLVSVSPILIGTSKNGEVSVSCTKRKIETV